MWEAPLLATLGRNPGAPFAHMEMNGLFGPGILRSVVATAIILVLLAVFAVLVGAAPEPPCQKSVAQTSGGIKRTLGQAALIFEARLSIDADGAPDAYAGYLHFASLQLLGFGPSNREIRLLRTWKSETCFVELTETKSFPGFWFSCGVEFDKKKVPENKLLFEG